MYPQGSCWIGMPYMSCLAGRRELHSRHPRLARPAAVSRRGDDWRSAAVTMVRLQSTARLLRALRDAPVIKS